MTAAPVLVWTGDLFRAREDRGDGARARDPRQSRRRRERPGCGAFGGCIVDPTRSARAGSIA
jgi:hypothetical protein